MNEHQPIVYGPVAEGERTISGGTYPMAGYGWSCSCGASGFGYPSEDDAETFVDAHLPDPGEDRTIFICPICEAVIEGDRPCPNGPHEPFPYRGTA